MPSASSDSNHGKNISWNQRSVWVLNLGRGLISAQPDAVGCKKLDEGKIVGCESVVSSRDTPTLLDLVEDPLDQVARSIEIRADADGAFSMNQYGVYGEQAIVPAAATGDNS